MRVMTAATYPTLTRLTGRIVDLQPLSHDDLPELFAAIGTPEVFAGGWGGGMAAYRDNIDEWREFILNYLPWDTAIVTGIRTRAEGTLVGTSSLMDIDPQLGSIHIGSTAYAPSVWGTGVNADAKRLLLELAFDHGFERVKIQADVINERSRAAILGIGATFEGILRHTQQRADGSWRDTAVYSILREEWPEVRDRLEQRVTAAAS